MSPDPNATQSNSGDGMEVVSGPATNSMSDDGQPTQVISEEVNTTCTVDGTEFYVTEATITSSLYGNSDMSEVKLVSDSDAEPGVNEPFTFDINGRRVFTGTTYEAKMNQKQVWSVKAMDAALTLQNHQMSLSVDSPTKISVLIKNVLEDANIEQYNIDIPKSYTVGDEEDTSSDSSSDSDSQSRQQSRAAAVAEEYRYGRGGDYHQPRYSRLMAKSVNNSQSDGGGSGTESGTSEDAPSDSEITFDNAKKASAALLTKLTQRANVMWWVDRFNVVWVGKPDAQYLQLKYILEADTGMSTPPYKGVVVSTGPVASEYGRDASNLVQLNGDVVKRGIEYSDGSEGKKATGQLELYTKAAMVLQKGTIFKAPKVETEDKTYKNLKFETTQRRDVYDVPQGERKRVTVPIRAVKEGSKYNVPAGAITHNVDGPMQLSHVSNPRRTTGGENGSDFKKEKWHIDNGEANEPVFYMKDKQITTKKEAKMVANAVINKFLEYVKRGKIVTVGDPFINKLDAVRMPDVMGGDKYLVEKVEHTLSSSDGYKTKIHTGALQPGHYEAVPGVGSYGGSLEL